MCGRNKNIIITFLLLEVTIFHQEVLAYHNEAVSLAKSGLDVWHQRNARVAARNDDLPCVAPSIYLCETHPDVISPEAEKNCNYRNENYHEQIFRWVSGRGCLLFTPDFQFVAGTNPINLNAGCFYENLFAPCVVIPKEDGTCGCYPYDPSFEEVANLVREAMVSSAYGRWERCFYSAQDCCSHFMSSVEVDNSTNNQICDSTFDGWTCWQSVEVGVTATEICSEFAYSNAGPSCDHYSAKQCFSSGVWELQTDYTSCSISPRLVRRYRFHIVMLSISIASCLPAVFVFFFYKRLRITRVILHRNLLIAIIIRNLLVIISRSEVYIDELTNSGDTVMFLHGIWCRILAVAERLAGNAVFICMLIEGVYLHRLIVTVFRQKFKLKLLYAIGASIAIIPCIAWTWVMAVYDDHSCWLVYTVPNIQWVIDAPRVAILFINTILFADVLRVLLTKIRNSENSSQLSTAKATLFLMPIFGTQFLLTAFRPNTSNCTGEQIYYYITYAIEGLQGFIVAMIYCYLNKEVRTLVKATYKKTENAVVSRVRRDSSYPGSNSVGTGMSVGKKAFSTALPPTDENGNKDEYAQIRPKLHVAEIISIQATERLADILEPVYETIDHGLTNEGYDNMERSELGTYSGMGGKDDEYGFTHASSISIECQDWIRCVSSPNSSVYNNSLNDFENKFFERKCPNPTKIQENARLCKTNTVRITPTIETGSDYENSQINNKNNKGGQMLDEILDCLDKKKIDYPTATEMSENQPNNASDC